MSENTIQVFHRWNAVLDVDTRTITFFVSKEYAQSQDEAETIDTNDLERWDQVMVLPFPEDNVGELDGDEVTFAGNPSYFDHTQLSKRFIPVDEFVSAVVRIMSKINEDLAKQVALEAMNEDSGWNIL